MVRVRLRRTRSHQVYNPQRLYGDHTVAVDQFAGPLVNEVMSSVSDTLMLASDDSFGFASFWRSVLVLDLLELTLSFGESLLILAEEAGVLDELPVTGHGKISDTHIHAYGFGGFRE